MNKSADTSREQLITRYRTNILKGYAIITVIMVHCNGFAGAFVNIPILNSQKLLSILCMIGMGLFLFTSGYGLYKSYCQRGTCNYWENKLKRVFVPFFAMQIFLLSITYIMDGFGDPIVMFLSILGIYPNNFFDSSMWFISYLFFWYFLFFVCFTLFKEKIALSLLIFGTFLTFYCTPGIWPNGFYCSLLFTFGIIISFIEEHNVECFKTTITKHKILIGIFAFLIYLYIWMRYLYSINYFLDNVLVFIGALQLIYISKIYEEKLSILYCVGGKSFYLYLIEMKCIVFPLKYILNKYSIYQFGALLFILFFICGISLAVIFEMIMIKINKLFKIEM